MIWLIVIRANFIRGYLEIRSEIDISEAWEDHTITGPVSRSSTRLRNRRLYKDEAFRYEYTRSNLSVLQLGKRYFFCHSLNDCAKKVHGNK